MSDTIVVNSSPSIQHYHHDTQALIEICNTISQEAFMKDVATVIRERIPVVTHALNKAFRFLTTWDYTRPEVLAASAIQSRLKRASYVDLLDIELYKPVGFTGQLDRYISQQLNGEPLTYISALPQNILGSALSRLGSYVSDVDNLTERLVDQMKTPYTRDHLDRLIDSEAQYMLKGNRSTEAPLGDLFANNNAIVTAFNDLNDANAKRWKSAPPKLVSSQVQSITKVANTLLSDIQSGQHAVSKEVLQAVTRDLELTAHWIEWYAAMMTRFLDTTSAMKANQEKLLRVL